MKTEWLSTNVTAVRSPVRAKSNIFRWFWLFWPIQAVFVVKQPLCDLETLFWALNTLLWIIWQKWSSFSSHLPEQKANIFGWFWTFLPISGRFCVEQQLSDLDIPCCLGPKNFTYDHLIKQGIDYQFNNCHAHYHSRKWFSDVILDVFCPIQAAFVDGQPLCDPELPSQALQNHTYLGSFRWKGTSSLPI